MVVVVVVVVVVMVGLSNSSGAENPGDGGHIDDDDQKSAIGVMLLPGRLRLWRGECGGCWLAARAHEKLMLHACLLHVSRGVRQSAMCVAAGPWWWCGRVSV